MELGCCISGELGHLKGILIIIRQSDMYSTIDIDIESIQIRHITLHKLDNHVQ